MEGSEKGSPSLSPRKPCNTLTAPPEGGRKLLSSKPPMKSRLCSACSRRNPRPTVARLFKRSRTCPRMFAGGLVVNGSVTAIRKTLRSSGDDVNAGNGTARTKRPPAESATTDAATNPVLQFIWSFGGVGVGLEGGTPSGSVSNLASRRGITVHPASRTRAAAHHARPTDPSPWRAAEVTGVGFNLIS